LFAALLLFGVSEAVRKAAKTAADIAAKAVFTSLRRLEFFPLRAVLFKTDSMMPGGALCNVFIFLSLAKSLALQEHSRQCNRCSLNSNISSPLISL
jgi:hypothetical protein